MKKSVLLLTLLGLLNLPARAQWVLQPFAFSNTIAPYLPNAMTIDIVDAQTVWTLATLQYMNLNFGDNEVARTTAGGTTWTVRTVPGVDFYWEILNGVKGFSASTALICSSSSATGGRIMRTVDGGLTWTTQTTSAQFTNPDSYADFFAFFSATEGICVGDPIALTGNRFELYRTLDAGTTWTAINTAAMPVGLSGEYATPYYKAQVGNHLWFSTNRGRVFHSPDKGTTWTVSQTSLTKEGSVAFRDALNGLLVVPGEGMVRTTDGGVSWQPVTYVGPAHQLLEYVPGTGQYLSAGQGPDAGSSYSRDNGATWTALETTRSHFDLAVLSPTVAWSAAVDFTSTTRAGLGAYKLTSTVLGTSAPVVLPANSVSVAPNPSADGRFVLTLAAGVRVNSYEVFDALGRQVLARALPAGTTCDLNLGSQAPGLYTLQVRTNHGLIQQKLVRQ